LGRISLDRNVKTADCISGFVLAVNLERFDEGVGRIVKHVELVSLNVRLCPLHLARIYHKEDLEDTYALFESLACLFICFLHAKGIASFYT
jgi:hypothetical protein